MVFFFGGFSIPPLFPGGDLWRLIPWYLGFPKMGVAPWLMGFEWRIHMKILWSWRIWTNLDGFAWFIMEKTMIYDGWELGVPPWLRTPHRWVILTVAPWNKDLTSWASCQHVVRNHNEEWGWVREHKAHKNSYKWHNYTWFMMTSHNYNDKGLGFLRRWGLVL